MQTDDQTPAPRPHRATKFPYLSRKVLLMVGSGILAGIIVIGGVYALRKPNPIPVAIRQAASFPVYYPAKEAPNTVLATGTIHMADGVVFLDLTNSSTKQVIHVAQQSMPADFDPKSQFEHANLPTTASPIGTVYDLSFKDQSRFMIVTNSSLIFITSSSKISNEQLQSIVNGLKTSR